MEKVIYPNSFYSFMKTDLVIAGLLIHENKVLLVHHKKLGLWLPPGGHIEKNETPDAALRREMKEELGISVEILNKPDFPMQGNIKEHLAVPFYSNVHSVGDHDHSCFYYICKPMMPDTINLNKEELNQIAWFTAEELSKPFIPADVRNIALLAFERFRNLE